MKRNSNLLLSLSLMLVITSTAWASGPLFEIGSDFGRTPIGEVWFADGTETSLYLNDGLDLAVGYAFDLSEGLELQTSVGVQWSEQLGANGGMSWRSYPWRAQLVAELGALSVGGGIAWFLDPSLQTDGVLSALGERHFDDALGYQAEVGWRLFANERGGGMQLGVRYTTVDFKTPAESLKGDAGGVFLRFQF